MYVYIYVFVLALCCPIPDYKGMICLGIYKKDPTLYIMFIPCLVNVVSYTLH